MSEPVSAQGARTLVYSLTPSGRIDVQTGGPDDSPSLASGVSKRILAAFDAGRGAGLLHLGAGEVGTDLHPTLAHWRDFGQAFVARACAATDPTDPKHLGLPEPDELAAFAQAPPPMLGAELIDASLLSALWSDLGQALAAEAVRSPDGVQGYLERHSSVWNVVGRVCFHPRTNEISAIPSPSSPPTSTGFPRRPGRCIAPWGGPSRSTPASATARSCWHVAARPCAARSREVRPLEGIATRTSRWSSMPTSRATAARRSASPTRRSSCSATCSGGRQGPHA